MGVGLIVIKVGSYKNVHLIKLLTNMKKIALFLTASLYLMTVSCGEDIYSIARWVEDYHQDKWDISTSQATLYCQLEKTESPKVYKGTLTIMENGIEWEIPLAVKVKGKDKEIVYKLSPGQNINQLQKEYSHKVELSYKIEDCQSWWDVGQVLTGDYLREYNLVEKQRQYLHSAYSGSYSSVADMNRYNEFLNNDMKQFLIKIGASSRIADDLVITNEQREKDIKSDDEWLREQVKKARNKWVDDNPAEARRRGITKF